MPDTKSAVTCIPAGVGAKLDKFDGLSDFERWLDHFNVVARANAWTPEQQALQLPTALTGAAFDLYRRLPNEERDSVNQLKLALTKEFAGGALACDYAVLFATRRRQVGEPLADFGEALKSLAKKAYSSFTQAQIDEMSKAHFINGLEDALRVQLLIASPEKGTFMDLVSQAQRLEKVLQPSLVRRLPEAGMSSSGDSDLKEEVKRLAEMVQSLDRKMSAMSTGASQRDNVPKTPCPKCGEKGHWGRNCPQRKAVASREPVVCFKCNQPGHMARGCANFQ